MQLNYIVKIIGNVSYRRFYTGGALIKVADSAILTVCRDESFAPLPFFSSLTLFVPGSIKL